MREREKAQESKIRRMEAETRLREREVELETLRVEGNLVSTDSGEQIGHNNGTRLPKLPNFNETKDEIDS